MLTSEALVKCLEKEKTEVVFGYPGVAICPVFDALKESSIKTVLVRQEQSAAHIASGYARITGKVGVAIATSGPGATNLITGIATAFADSIPLVCITGQVNSQLIGSDVFQEADITGAADSFVKHSYLVRDEKELPRILKEAFYIAGSGRKGPVLIDLPFDVQMSEIAKFTYPESVTMRTYKPTVEGNAVQIKKVIKELDKAKRPVLCAGGGVHLSDATDLIRKFARMNDIPVVSTMMGIGVMPTEDPLYFGMVGNNGRPYANRALNEADLVMIVGARVADRAVNRPEIITDGKVLIHIDVDPAEIGKNAGPTIPLVGDIAHIFAQLNKMIPTKPHKEWVKTLKGYEETMIEPRYKTSKKFVNAGDFITTLSKKMKDDGVYVVDVGQNQIWSCRYYWVRDGRFLTSGGMGTMGYALPAAIGAKIASPKTQVVAVCGDGGFQMTMQELATMKQYDVPVKLVILNNGVLGMVREYQHHTYGDRYHGISLSGNPDFSYIAKAYGMNYDIVKKDAEVKEKVEKFLKDKSAGILEVKIDPDDLVVGR